MLLTHKTTVKFDPSKKSHRNVVRQYLATGRLATDEYKFAHNPKYVSVAHQLQAELLQYYLNKEAPIKVAQLWTVKNH